MKKNILISTLLSILVAASSVSAEEYTCPVDGNYMSGLFKKNWKNLQDEGRPMYYSYVEMMLGDKLFRGSLHTLSAQLPEDSDPHLEFARAKLQLVHERYVWSIDCEYTIGNLAMVDLEDRYLHFSTVVTLDKRCKQVSNTTVSCV